jgi:hypothetical protein
MASFQAAKPIDKGCFLALYRQVAQLTRLIFAPFGLAAQSADIVGSLYAQALYKQPMQHLEDVLSKCLFKYYHIDDDAIVASMHEYIGKTQDQTVSHPYKGRYSV